jgi:hypothetical protein
MLLPAVVSAALLLLGPGAASVGVPFKAGNYEGKTTPEAFRSSFRVEAVAQRPSARGTPTLAEGFCGRGGSDQLPQQAPDETGIIPFLKRPDTSSHGFTLGLCDSLARKGKPEAGCRVCERRTHPAQRSH